MINNNISLLLKNNKKIKNMIKLTISNMRRGDWRTTPIIFQRVS